MSASLDVIAFYHTGVTRSRRNNRELYGVIGTMLDASALLQTWNAFFRLHSIDAMMERYPTTVALLPERLSEMFHFDRRLYLVAPDLQRAVLPMLDVLDAASQRSGSVDVIVNRDGVLSGRYTGGAFDPRSLHEDPQRR